MSEITIIGIDLAKRVFQLHGACLNGTVAFRKKLSRGQLLAFVARQPKCIIAMEACATAHGWGREFERLGHEVRLIAPAYVKPFVKRQKNDVADAEAIVEAALRPTMRFVVLKTEDQQARAMLFRTRQMFVGQRTQLINALRRHLAEHGLVAARGPAHLKRLADPSGRRDGVSGQGPDLRLLIIGDSSAVGVGTSHQEEALLGHMRKKAFADKYSLLVCRCEDRRHHCRYDRPSAGAHTTEI